MRRAISSILALLIAVTSVSTTANAASWSTTWMPMKVSNTTSVNVPKDNFSLLGSLADTAGPSSSVDMINNERWITLGRSEAGSLGLTGDQVSSLMKRFPSGGAVVFGRYDPMQAQLRLQVLKVEKAPDNVRRVYLGDFTPHHGNWWAAARKYLTAAEAANPDQAGHNPFANFSGASSDPIFHNISFSAAQVAVGHAMRFHGAHSSFVAVPEPRFDQGLNCDNGFLIVTCTSWVNGYAKPVWWVGLPIEMQPVAGVSSHICVVGSGSGCDAQEHLAVSGVSFRQWNGGTLPVGEDQIYHWENTDSSWTVLSYLLLTSLIFLSGSYWALEAGLGDVAAGLSASEFGGSVVSTVGGLTPSQWALASGASYFVGTNIVNDQGLFGGNLTEAQASYLGTTGNGVVQPITPSDSNGQAMAANLQQKMIEAAPSGSLSAISAGYNSVAPSTGSYAEYNTVAATRARYQKCLENGLTGDALRRCAGPTRTGVFSGVFSPLP